MRKTVSTEYEEEDLGLESAGGKLLTVGGFSNGS